MGMVAKGNIDLQGNNIRSDSFDSSSTSHSTNGRYDASKAGDKGDIATNASLLNSFNAGNANIYGRVSTGPGGAVNVGSQGSVGSTAWHAGNNNGIQPGYFSDDMNVQFLDVKAPFNGGGFTPAPGSAAGTNYTYLLGSGNWQMTSLT